MNITRDNIDELNSVLRLKLQKEDYEDKVNNVLKDYRKKARIDGFRPGKVPFGLISKMYRKPVMVEEIHKLISSALSDYLVKENLNILGDPLPHEEERPEIDWDRDTDFEFAFDIGLAPEFDVQFSKKDKIPRYRIKIDNKLRQKYIDGYASRYGSFKPAEKISSDEMIKADIVELNAEGKPAEEGIQVEDASISIDMIKDEKIKKSFIGLRAGDVLAVDLKKALPNVQELSGLLNIDKEKAASLDNEFQLTIKSVSKYEKAEVNQEFWDKLFGKDNVNSKEEFIKRIDEEIESVTGRDSEFKLRKDIKEEMVKKFKKDLPAEFLKRWIRETNKEGVKEKQLEEEFPLFEEDLKWQLIKDKLMRDNNIEVTEQEILDFAKDFARLQFMQYGLGNMPEENIEAYAREIMNKEEERRRLYERKAEDKVISLIRDQVRIDEKEISSEKFDKMLEK